MSTAAAARADRLCDVDSEAAILAAAIADERQRPVILAAIRDEDMGCEESSAFLAAVRTLVDRRRPVTFAAVSVVLRERGVHAAHGGEEAVQALATLSRTVGPVDAQVDRIRSLAKRRAARDFAMRLRADEALDLRDVDAWAGQAAAKMAAIAVGGGADQIRTMRGAVGRFAARWSNPDQGGWYLTTGIEQLDRLTGGLWPTELVAIGAYSGLGKTTLALGIVAHVLGLSEVDGAPPSVAVISLEMTEDELTEKLVCSLAAVNARKLNPLWRGQPLDVEEGRRVVSAQRWMEHRVDRLYVDDSGGQTATSIAAKTRAIAARAKLAGAPLRCLLVDYVQLVRSEGKHGNREQEVAAISHSLKELAKELGIVVLAPAQLNNDGRKDKRRPRTTDFRESAALEHDANAAILIHNPGLMERLEAKYANGVAEHVGYDTVDECDLIVGKRRGRGAVGMVRAEFHPAIQRFADWQGDPSTLSSTSSPTTRSRRST